MLDISRRGVIGRLLFSFFDQTDRSAASGLADT